MTEGGRRHFGGLWRQRNFRLLWIGETVSQVGNAMAVVGVPLVAVVVLHASTFAVGLLTAAGWLPWLVIGLPAGAWVDRLPVRPVMICADLLAAVLYGSVPLAAWTGVLSIGLLVAIQLAAGAASVVFMTGYQVYLPSVVAAADLIEANTKMQGSASAAAFAGPGLAGLVALVVGAVTALAGNAVSFCVSAGCLLGSRPSVPPPGERCRRNLRKEIAAGVLLLVRDPYLRPMTVFWSAANFALTGYTALLVVFLVRIVGLSAGWVGVLTAVPGLGGVLGALVTRRVTVRFGTARGLLLATWLGMPAALLIPLTGPGSRLVCYVAGALVAYTGMGIGNIIIAAFRQAHSPPGMCGRVTATQRFFIFATSPMGAFAGGSVGTWLGIRPALWIMLGMAVASGSLLCSRGLVADRDLPGHGRSRPVDQQETIFANLN
ncbi:MAG TPA: MFS transporter [Streptosporangiaceae bacterium]|nr:MFS transporter [Streptosporangiaceae bacterium]